MLLIWLFECGFMLSKATINILEILENWENILSTPWVVLAVDVWEIFNFTVVIEISTVHGPMCIGFTGDVPSSSVYNSYSSDANIHSWMGLNICIHQGDAPWLETSSLIICYWALQTLLLRITYSQLFCQVCGTCSSWVMNYDVNISTCHPTPGYLYSFLFI